MFLTLSHQKLEVFNASRLFVLECYRLTTVLPAEEKFSMVTQIRRAALSVHLNIAEGSSRKSAIERKRFYEIARGSIIEIDAALDLALELKYISDFNTKKLGETMVNCFKLLSGVIQSQSRN